jgi:hypothetical protein
MAVSFYFPLVRNTQLSLLYTKIREAVVQKTIETLLLRNLQEVFGEGEPTRRSAAIAELYTENCVVLLPIGRYVGQDALDRVAGELRAGHPTGTCGG